LDEKIDMLGASIQAGAGFAFASGLSRNKKEMLNLMAEVVTLPAFPEAELERIRREALAGLASQQDDPGQISSNIAGVANFGDKHPYGEVTDKKTIEAVTLQDIRNMYTQVFSPKSSYLAIVGDITLAEAKALTEEAFGRWAGEKLPSRKFPDAQAPQSSQVFLYDRGNSVQSSIRLTYPIDLKPGAPDAIAVRVMANILGGGMSGRLFKNLRETHAYTYGSYASISADPLKGSFTITADVRNSVTDSAVYQMVAEMNRIVSEPISMEEIDRTKAEITGAFARSLEDPGTIARFAINIERYKLPETYYQDYLTTLANLTQEDIQNAALNYVKPFGYNLVVVGRRDSIEAGLLTYDADGKISFFDAFGRKAGSLAPVPEGVTAQTVVDRFVQVSGGMENINSIKSISQKAEASIQGFTIEMETDFKGPDKGRMMAKQMGQVAQKVVVNGKKGSTVDPSGEKPLDENDIKETLAQLNPVLEAVYANYGYTVELQGSLLIDGERCYQMKFVGPSGSVDTRWYSEETGVLIKSNGAMGSTVYSRYQPVNGVMLPHQLDVTEQGMSLTFILKEIKVNHNLENSLFELK
jgi:predicted Zn-dependent peptidase